MRKQRVHEWHENREPEEGGGKRYYRAQWTRDGWVFQITEPEDEDWLPLPEPELEVYIALRDVLWRKYQRRRLPHRFLKELDAWLADRGVEVDT